MMHTLHLHPCLADVSLASVVFSCGHKFFCTSVNTCKDFSLFIYTCCVRLLVSFDSDPCKFPSYQLPKTMAAIELATTQLPCFSSSSGWMFRWVFSLPEQNLSEGSSCSYFYSIFAYQSVLTVVLSFLIRDHSVHASFSLQKCAPLQVWRNIPSSLAPSIPTCSRAWELKGYSSV